MDTVKLPHTKIVGLTGGIGTGKSTASEYLISRGCRQIDADAISRRLTRDGSPLLEELDRVFGPDGEWGKPGYEILKAPGVLDRQAMADLVFHDPARKKRFEDIILTEIIRIIDGEVAAYRGKDAGVLVLLDAPLLFEAGLQDRCDQVLLIVADLETRIRRVCLRDGMTEQQVRDRIANQMSDEEKSRLADVIVDNSGDLEHLHRQLEEFLANF